MELRGVRRKGLVERQGDIDFLGTPVALLVCVLHMMVKKLTQTKTFVKQRHEKNECAWDKRVEMIEIGR